MDCMLSAEFTEFFLLDFVLLFFLVSGRSIVASLAFCTLKGYDISHLLLA
jgi:hypothetical protein